jgi:dephospho-CoA kinase
MRNDRIALTGGIATGKSTVAGLFTELGAVILDADQFARQAVEPGTVYLLKLHDLLGDDFFDHAGHLKRRKLREHIVADARLRAQVNSILHPYIMQAMEEEWRQRTAANSQQIIIFDIPLLFEAKLTQNFGLIILVYAPREIQIERLMHRDKISRAQAEQTLTMQLPIEFKRPRAEIVIDNSSDLEQTRRQVAETWRALKGA